MIKDELLKAVPTITQSVIAETDKKWSDLFKNQNKLVDTSLNPKAMCFKGNKLAKEIVAEEERQRSIIVRGLDAHEIQEGYDGDPRGEVDHLLIWYMKVPSLKESIVKCALIGNRYKPACSASETQAVKVTFKSKDDAHEALRYRFILKDNVNTKFVYLSPDRCASERKLLKELVQGNS